ncbi:MAG TPA: DUF3298 domain-containing protein [Catalimonadaceae bacterium]|nr:DUF3298 domain-containing protein [Catalimonadaceae bacterium]
MIQSGRYFLVGWALVLCFSCRENSQHESSNRQADSLGYEMVTLTREHRNCIADSMNCTRILLSFPKFNLPKGDLADSLAFWQNQAIGNPDAKISDPNLVMDFFMRLYEERIKEDPGYSIPWNLDKRLSVVGQNKRWISLEMSYYGYEGGAHDNGNVQYINLEKSSGRRLFLSDFFDSTSLPKLTQLGEKYFCEVREIRPEQSLDEAGFSFENNRFFLPENFYFNPSGLTFSFNAYEVGPYVMGETTFTIPANKLVMLMRKEENP